MSRLLFTSDTHFGHSNVTRFRTQFTDSVAHDTYLRESILQHTTKRDTLWILGDVAFTKEAFELNVVPIANHVRDLHVIIGNHDFEKKRSSEAPTTQDYLNAGIHLHGLVKLHKFWLSHAPIHPDELRGCPNIHGHTHNICMDSPNYINVCGEQSDFIPINFQQIKKNLHEATKTI